MKKAQVSAAGRWHPPARGRGCPAAPGGAGPGPGLGPRARRGRGPGQPPGGQCASAGAVAPGLSERQRGDPPGAWEPLPPGNGLGERGEEEKKIPPGLAIGVPQPVEKLQQTAGPAAESWEISEGTGKNCRCKSVVCVSLTSARTLNNRRQQCSGCGSRCLPARRSSVRRRAGAVGAPAFRPSSSSRWEVPLSAAAGALAIISAGSVEISVTILCVF